MGERYLVGVSLASEDWLGNGQVKVSAAGPICCAGFELLLIVKGELDVATGAHPK